MRKYFWFFFLNPEQFYFRRLPLKFILGYTCTFEIYQKDLSCSIFKLFLSFLECSL